MLLPTLQPTDDGLVRLDPICAEEVLNSIEYPGCTDRLDMLLEPCRDGQQLAIR